MLNRRRKEWAIQFCMEFFGLVQKHRQEIEGDAGRRRLMRMWFEEGEKMYSSPLYALRQEWWHTYSPEAESGQIPAFWQLLPERAVILDYGCGTGEYARRNWYDRNRYGILVDIPGPLLRYTNQKYRFQKNTRVYHIYENEWRQEQAYDAIVCTDVLEHLKDPVGLTEVIWNYLKPGGMAIFGFSRAYPHPGHLRESIDDAPKWEKWINKHAAIMGETGNLWVSKPMPKE